MKYVLWVGLGLLLSVCIGLGLPNISIADTPADVEVVRQVIYQGLLQDEELEPSLASVDALVVFAEDTTTGSRYAMGSWIVGDMGGVEILQQVNSTWTSLCATGGAYNPDEMVQFCGVPLPAAQQLWEQWSGEVGQ